MERRRRNQRRHRSDLEFPYFDGDNNLVFGERRTLAERRDIEPSGSHLLLVYQGRITEITSQAVPIILGRTGVCDFVVKSAYASRMHARLERRGDEFYVIDQSRNGTYIKNENRPALRLHHGEGALWGYGFISLGCPVGMNEHVIRFSSR